MCPPKAPSMPPPEQPVYAKDTPDIEKAPQLDEKKDNRSTTEKANRRGLRQLRTDLPESEKARQGLNIPT
jgi:5'-3' exonuclease